MTWRTGAKSAKRAFGAAALLVGLATASGSAGAETTQGNKAAAEALYDQGKKLMAGGQFEAACAKLAESQKLDPGVGTLLTLGDCYERTSRKASAWATFREAAALAKTRRQAAREKLARTRAAALESKLAVLVIEVPAESEVSGIAVLRDEEPVAKALWGTSLPVDSGPHTVRVTAPGRKPWTLTVRIDKDGQTFTVSVPPLSPEVTAVAPSRPPPGSEAPPAVQSGSGLRTAGFVAGGLGLAGIGAGVGLGFLALSRHDEAQKRCSPTCVAGGGEALQADANKIALGSTIAFTAGGLVLAAGVVFLIAAPSARAKAGAVHVVPVVTADVQGAMIHGTF